MVIPFFELWRVRGWTSLPILAPNCSRRPKFNWGQVLGTYLSQSWLSCNEPCLQVLLTCTDLSTGMMPLAKLVQSSLCQPTRKPTCVMFEHRRSESAACIETYVVFFRWLIGGSPSALIAPASSISRLLCPEMRLQDLENRGLSSGGDASASHCGSVWLSARSSWNCSWTLEASARPSVCSRRKSSSTAHAFAAWWPGRLPCHIVTQWACYVKTICLVIVYIFVGYVRCFAVPRHIFSKTERYDVMNRQISKKTINISKDLAQLLKCYVKNKVIRFWSKQCWQRSLIFCLKPKILCKRCSFLGPGHVSRPLGPL